LFVVWSKTLLLLLPPAEIITKLVCVLFKPFFFPLFFSLDVVRPLIENNEKRERDSCWCSR
jgi:hypothetical protein